MKKEAYYFPHFVNARNDRKIKRLRKQLGVEGYAIYFMLLEVLREQDSMRYPMKDVDLLADDFGTSEQKVRAVIEIYELFEIDEDQCFTSAKLIEFMAPYLRMKEQRALAGRASAAARSEKLSVISSTNAEHSFDDSSTNVEQKKRKEKKREEREEKKETRERVQFSKPSVDEVCEILERREAEKFVAFYTSKDWHVGKTKMRDWRAAARGWKLRNSNDRLDTLDRSLYRGDTL